jgi:hypothetical protein
VIELCGELGQPTGSPTRHGYEKLSGLTSRQGQKQTSADRHDTTQTSIIIHVFRFEVLSGPT